MYCEVNYITRRNADIYSYANIRRYAPAERLGW